MNTAITTKLEGELKTVANRYTGQTDSLNRTLKDFVERATAIFTIEMNTEELTVPRDEILSAVRNVYPEGWQLDTLIYCRTAKKSITQYGDMRMIQGGVSLPKI